MRRKSSYFLILFVSFFITTISVWPQSSKREMLKQKFAPGNFRQMQNIMVNDEDSYYPQVPQSRERRAAMGADLDRSGIVSGTLAYSDPVVGEYAIYQSEYTAEIEEEIAFIKGKIVFEVFKKRGWVKIPLVSSSVGLKEASLNKKPSFVLREGSKYVLFVDKPGKYNLELEFFIQVKREREHGPGSLNFTLLPSPISILDVEMQDKDVEIFVQPSIKIETERTPKKTMATVVLPYTEHVTIRWSKALPKEEIPEVVLVPKLYADVITLVSVGDGVAKCYSTIQYSILQSEVSNLRVSFPEDVGILQVTGGQLRDWKVKNQDKRQLLDVYLNYGVKGNYTLNVTYERNIGSGSVTTSIPEIFVVSTERQRGFTGIEARTNIELSFNKLNGATITDVKELPQQIWNRARNPILLAFKHLKYPYGVIIDVTKHEEIPVLVAAIDSANYVTLFTKEGKVLTKATYQMRNNVKQFIRLTLPKDASLWSCFVSGKPVKPARDKKGKILIPLEKSQIQGEALTQFPVEVVYMTKKPKFSLGGNFKLELPKLDIPESELLWSVYLPDKFNYYRFRGDVELIRGRLFHQTIGSSRSQSGYLKKSVKRRMEQVADQVGGRYDSQVSKEKAFFKDFEQAQVKGMLPIKINIPQRGRMYRFGKLLVTDESPWMSAVYVRSLGGFVKFLLVLVVFLIVIRLIIKAIRAVRKKT